MRLPLTGLLLAGGLAAAQTVTPAGSLNGRWTLMRLSDGRQSQAVTGEQAPTLNVGGVSVSGSTGCNNFGGHLEAGAGALKVGNLISTLRACSAPLNAQQGTYLKLLSGATRYAVTARQLTLLGREGLLVFQHEGTTAPAAPDGDWQLQEASQNGQALDLSAPKRLTLSLRGREVNGFGGCNGFGGSVTVGGTSLRFGPLIHTMRACTNVSANHSESAYLKLLSKVTGFQLQAGTLTLRTMDGATLVFTPAAP